MQGLANLTREWKEGRWRGCPATGEMTSLSAATFGASTCVVAGLAGSGGAAVALLCASARRSGLLPEVVDDCSCVGRKLNEIVFAVNVLGHWRYWLFCVLRKGGVLHIVHRPGITCTSPAARRLLGDCSRVAPWGFFDDF